MTKILIDRATVEQALEALELAYDYTGQDTESGRELCREARVAAKGLRTALAEPVQEPVTWGVDWGRDGDQSCVSIIKKHADGTAEVVAVEYSPPQRKPLTDGKISWLWSDAHNDTTDRMAFQVFARSIEAAHGIKEPKP